MNKNSIYEPIENTSLGFTTFSEKINGRAAMIGFFLVFFAEFLTKKNIFSFLFFQAL